MAAPRGWGGALRPTKRVLSLEVVVSRTNTSPFLAPDPGFSWVPWTDHGYSTCSAVRVCCREELPKPGASLGLQCPSHLGPEGKV